MPGTEGSPGLVIEQIRAGHEPELAALFHRITRNGDDKFFHPHAFDDRMASEIANYQGRDLYLAATLPTQPAIVGYGMLRGWDAGYDVPSLGIIIAPDARGRGFARLLMLALHQHAREHGASRIRLKVYPSNSTAVNLYQSLGYQFIAEEHGQLVGVVTL